MKPFTRSLSSFTRLLLLLPVLIALNGCRGSERGSLARPVEAGGYCQGGACQITSVPSVMDRETPAELFAKINHESHAADETREAVESERVARLPKGPDSLFAPYRK